MLVPKGLNPKGLGLFLGGYAKLFEITRDKKVVWRYSGMKHGFHHFQILTTNGKPLQDNTWK